MLTTSHKPHKSWLKSRLIWIVPSVILVIALSIYSGVCIYAASVFNQVSDRSQTFAITPANYNLSYQEVSFPSAAPAPDNLTLRGWWIARPGVRQALIIVHGKASSRMELLEQSPALVNMGFNLLYFDLRGHGASDGDHYYYGQYESWDVVGAFNFVKSQGIAPANIGILARSMGAATSLLAMGHSDEIRTIFSDSSYANFSDVAERLLPIEKGLPSFFLPGIFTAGRLFYRFDVDQTRPEMVLAGLRDRHIYLVHDEKDDVILVSHFYRLRDAGGSNIVGSWVASGAGHTKAIDLYPQEYLLKVQTFFKTYLGSE